MINFSILRLSKVHWFIIIVAICLSTITIYSTNIIVKQLKNRENKDVELYRDNLEFIQNADSNQDLSIHLQILEFNETIPTILVNTKGEVLRHKNVNVPKHFSEARKQKFLNNLIVKMENAHAPLLISLRDQTGKVYDYQYVYYDESNLLKKLQFYPYLQLVAIFMIIAVLLIIIRLSADSESNKLWVGLAKETAHQLGTPISSLMAWIEYLKSSEVNVDQAIIDELSKDTDRLTRITDRFSNIGSTPKLMEEDVYETILNTVNYLQPRIPKNTKISIKYNENASLKAYINRNLFEWVIENLCKNAVDAMTGKGNITINIQQPNQGKIVVDIQDEGKGIKQRDLKQIFNAGFSSKKRGWGLGLALVKRIIKDYHKGKIYVKNSQVDVGTTFRLELYT